MDDEIIRESHTTIDKARRHDLVEFLKSLTDQSFLTDPRFSDPFATGTP